MSVLDSLQGIWRTRKEPAPIPVERFSGKKMVFIGGVHRSGTSPLHRLLRRHPDISGFEDTGAIQDEGQHLQSVVPSDKSSGGPGHFAYDVASQMDASSFPNPQQVRCQLLQEWGPHWDLEKPVLVEKSPLNLIRSGALKVVFPEAKFLFIVRHPIAVSLATQKWSETSVCELFAHWVLAHRILLRDLTNTGSDVLVLRYEDLVRYHGQYLRAICKFIDVSDFEPEAELEDKNIRYFEEWEQQHRASQLHLREFFANELKFAAKFGYQIDGGFVIPHSMNCLHTL